MISERFEQCMEDVNGQGVSREPETRPCLEDRDARDFGLGVPPPGVLVG